MDTSERALRELSFPQGICPSIIEPPLGPCALAKSPTILLIAYGILLSPPIDPLQQIYAATVLNSQCD
jgi:hypothetical protein